MSADLGELGSADIAANANSAARTNLDSSVVALATLLMALCAAVLA